MKFFQPFSIFLLFVGALTTTCLCQPKTNPVRSAANTTTKSFPAAYSDTLPSPCGYVNDFEDIFTESEEMTLNSLIKDFEKNTTIQIAVITIDSTMTTKNGVEDITRRFADHWGVGQKGKDNGVTIGISKAYRRMRIENGNGIRKIFSDNETKEIIDGVFVPDFRKGEYFKGTLNGLKAIINILEKRTEGN